VLQVRVTLADSQGARETLEQTLRHQIWKVCVIPELDLLDLVRGCGGREVAVAELTAAEDEQDLAALLRVWRPVDDEQSTDGRFDAEFLADLGRAACFGLSPGSTYPPAISQPALQLSLTSSTLPSGSRNSALRQLRAV
jgi:hypothetical protein